jgi:hypothetical protein
MHTFLYNVKNILQILAVKPVKKIIQTKQRGRLEDNIVTYRPIARQRLGKHIPAGANPRNNRTSIAKQLISEHT